MRLSSHPSATVSTGSDVRQPPVRLGVIDYLNVAPVYDALRQGPTDALSSDAFRELNAAIKQSKA